MVGFKNATGIDKTCILGCIPLNTPSLIYNKIEVFINLKIIMKLMMIKKIRPTDLKSVELYIYIPAQIYYNMLMWMRSKKNVLVPCVMARH